MAINKEIWLPSIEGNFYSEWEILSKMAKDDSMYVSNATVHLPNAGANSTVAKNNTSYPVNVEERTDTVNDYDIASYQMAPVRLGAFDVKDLSYDKMISVVQDHTGRLGEYVKFDILTSWYIGKVSGKYVETSGTTTEISDAPGSTAAANVLTLSDVRKAAKILDNQNVPIMDRILLLPSSMYYQLLEDTIDTFSINDNDGLAMFNKTLNNFTVIMQPQVINVTSAGTLRAYGNTGAITDLQVGLALQKDQVSFARADVKVYDQAGVPGYYGDIVSAETWAGGKYRRGDKKGVVPIIQAT
jgi:hypothetical protein